MPTYRIQVTESTAEEVECEALMLQTTGAIACLRTRACVATQENGHKTMETVPYKVFNQWISFTDTSFDNK